MRNHYRADLLNPALLESAATKHHGIESEIAPEQFVISVGLFRLNTFFIIKATYHLPSTPYSNA